MEARTFAALKGVGKILTNWEESGGAKVETDPDMRKLVEVFKSLEKRYNRMNTAPVLKALEKRVRVPLPSKSCATKCDPTNSNCVSKCKKRSKSFFSRLFSK